MCFVFGRLVQYLSKIIFFSISSYKGKFNFVHELSLDIERETFILFYCLFKKREREKEREKRLEGY